MNFDDLLDRAARAAQRTFKREARYCYDHRATGERFEFADEEAPIETEILYEITDVAGGVTATKKGRGFLVTRFAKERLDAWLAGRATPRRVGAKSLPYAGDAFIVQNQDGSERRYRMDGREPLATLGTNQALYRFNTFLEWEHERTP